MPHHLLDVLSPQDEFSVSSYLDAARRIVAEIRQRGREALFVGGTPLYLKALLRGIFRGPPADWEFRRAVEEELVQVGLPALYQRLQQVDPLSAAKLHPNDKRRIIRALEVYRATGRPISHLQTQFEEGRSANRCRVFVLGWPRDVLHGRINRRVEAMFAAGFVDEVRGLLDRHGELSRTAAASGRLPRGDRTPPRATGLGRDDRGGQSPHPAIRPPSRDLVSQSERMPIRAAARGML